MLKHNHDDESEQYRFDIDLESADTGSAPTSNGELQTGELSSTEPFEEYLDTIIAPLVGSVPRARRLEIRQRVLSRLILFQRAHCELGSSLEEAAELAIVQSGDPQIIADRWLPLRGDSLMHPQTNTRGLQGPLKRLSGSATGATVIATTALGLPYIGFVNEFSENLWRSHYSIDGPHGWAIYYRFYLLLVPLMAGLCTGILAKQRPTRGIVNAVGLLSIWTLILPGLLCGLGYAELFTTNSELLAHIIPSPIPALCGIVPWLVLACGGAAIGHRIRKSSARLTRSASKWSRKREIRRTGLRQAMKCA